MNTNRHVKFLLVVGSLSGVSAGFAQTPLYQDVTSSHLPPSLAGACMDATAGDADNDGDADLALAMEFETNILLLNDGSGNFTDASEQLPRTAHDSEDVAFFDVDNDRDQDLAFVSEDDRTDELWINGGDGRFTEASERITTDDVSNALAVMDLDGDGIPDLLTGNIGVDRVLISDGAGGFRDETQQRWPQGGNSRTQDLELADIDSDGDLDVLVANEGQNQLFRNDAGLLVDVTAGNLPVRNDETREIRAADVDGDADLDLLVANVQFSMPEPAQDYLLLNDGNGVFTTAEPGRYPEDARSNFTVQAVDVDRDGDLDVLAPSTVFGRAEAEYVVMVADEAGVMRSEHSRDLLINDADNDGDIDAVANDADRSRTFVYDGGKLVLQPDEAARESTGTSQSVDIDSDGQPELMVATFPMAHMQSGNAAQPPEDANAGVPANQARTRGQSSTPQIQVLDLGGDGDIDIVVTVNRIMDAIGDYLVLLNDGTGYFTPASPGAVLPPEADGNGFDIEVADFDADGITDLFFCNRASVKEGDAAAISGGLQRLLRGVR